MKRFTAVSLLLLIVISASFGLPVARRTVGEVPGEIISLSRQADFARFIQQIGFSDEQLVRISGLVQSTRSGIFETHEEGIALMEQALEEAIAGNVEQSRETEQRARALIAEARTHVQKYLDSMRETVTVAQQERMLSLSGSKARFKFGTDSRFDQRVFQHSLAVISEAPDRYRFRGRDGRVFVVPGKQFEMPYYQVLPEKITARYLARIELPEAFRELPLGRLFEMIPERERSIVEEKVKSVVERFERLLPDARVVRKTSFDAICLTFLLEENAEVLRRIAEQ